MEDARREAVVEFCHEQAGGTLRSVLAYELDGTDVEPDVWYVRDDLVAEYGPRQVETAARTVLEEAALEAVGNEWLEHVHRFGQLTGTVRVFDGATIAHCWTGDGRGVSVSLDPGADVDFEGLLRGIGDRATDDPD